MDFSNLYRNMTPLKLTAQAVGLLGIILTFVLYQQKERKKLLGCKLCLDTIWGTHYLLLGAWSGLISNLIALSRDTVFINRGKKWVKEGPFWPIFFIGVTWAYAILSWKNIWNLLPLIGVSMAITGFWAQKPTLTRSLTVPVAILFIIYDIYVGSPIGLINEIIGIASAVSGLIRLDILPALKEKKQIQKEREAVSQTHC